MLGVLGGLGGTDLVLGVLGGLGGTDLVLGVPGEAAELSELQLDAGHLGHRAVGGPAGRVGRALPDVDVRVGDLRGGVEGRHQPGPDVDLERAEREGAADIRSPHGRGRGTVQCSPSGPEAQLGGPFGPRMGPIFSLLE